MKDGQFPVCRPHPAVFKHPPKIINAPRAQKGNMNEEIDPSDCKALHRAHRLERLMSAQDAGTPEEQPNT